MRVLCFVRVLCCIWKFSCSVCECGLKRNRTDLNSDVGFLEKPDVALHVVKKTLEDMLSLAGPMCYEKEPRHVLIASCNQTSTRLCVHHNSVIHGNLSVGIMSKVPLPCTLTSLTVPPTLAECGWGVPRLVL